MNGHCKLHRRCTLLVSNSQDNVNDRRLSRVIISNRVTSWMKVRDLDFTNIQLPSSSEWINK